jgi:hypothetical protein
MRMRTQMTRRGWFVPAALVLIAMAAAGSAFAVASSRNDSSSTLFTVGQGVRISAQVITDQERTALTASGATDQLYLLGQHGDHGYYRAVGADGHTCYALGRDAALLSLACLHSGPEMPTALIDMSCCGVLTPSGRAVFRLEAVEGIAADQVSAVGVERKDGSCVTVAVSDNSYRFAPDAIPSDPVAIVAIDESGAVIQRKTLG